MRTTFKERIDEGSENGSKVRAWVGKGKRKKESKTLRILGEEPSTSAAVFSGIQTGTMTTISI